jgi:hypothetical protein
MDSGPYSASLPQQPAGEQITGASTAGDQTTEGDTALAVWTHTTKLDNVGENPEAHVLRGIE